MSHDNDNFDDLFIDESDAFDTSLVKTILQKHIQFTSKGELLPLQSFSSMDGKKKLLLVLLSRKVLAYRKMAEERIGPKDIENITGLPHGTVTSALAALVKERLVRTEKGKYWIPNFALTELKKMLA